MKQIIIKILAASATAIMLTGCAGFFDKDNTPTPSPLTRFTPEIKTKLMWYRGVNFGVGSDYLKMVPAVTDHAIFTADKEGDVTATNRITGSNLWHYKLQSNLSAGPGTDESLLFIGSRTGKVYALRQSDGALVWEAQVSSEILTPPVASRGIVLVKAIDGQLTALDARTGRAMWHYLQTEPALILRGGSVPQVTRNDVVVGFANGNLAKLTLQDGSLLWQQMITVPEGSFAIQRMVDIDADPVVFNNRVYVATYQGKIAALDLTTGKVYWTHDISSFTGLTVDNQRVYVADATSHLWAFDADSGGVAWRQNQLEARNITGPATIANYLVVADQEGFLHWINKQDGHFIARNRVTGFGILATPIVRDNNVYLLTRDGHLANYTLVS
ncbi:MAG: outer membrane protein assembly factor BamB [Pseudomonadota bacterium]